MKPLTEGIAVPALLATFALGGVGAALAWALGLPLPMMLGPLLLVGGAAMARVRLFGHLPAVPQRWRQALIPVIGVAIGAMVPVDVLAQLSHWWVSALALVVFVPAAHALSYQVYRRLGGIDPRTAYFAAMPGGFIEAMEMGERAGARMDMLVSLQFLRLALCIVGVPVAFSLATGQAVGSGAVSMAALAPAPDPRDAALLIAAGLGGWLVAAWLRLPAAALLGPLVASAALHVAGLTAATPPGWAVALTQVVVGTSLGARFAGFTRQALWLALRLSAVNVALILALASVLGLALSGAVGEPAPAVILAFAPGGVVEMSLVALSLQMSAIFVTLHHLLRIVLAVVVAKAGLRWLPR